jgi:hypothetical protein
MKRLAIAAAMVVGGAAFGALGWPAQPQLTLN